MKKLSLFAIAMLLAGHTHASLIYTIDRTIGDASVTGFIETDGSLGPIGFDQFLDFSLTLLAPNINGGLASTATLSSQFFGPVVLEASVSALSFDFDASSLWGVYTSSGDFWCLAGNAGGCFRSGAEVVGDADVGPNPAYFQPYSGLNAIASVSTSVPAPGSAALFTFALAIVALARRTGLSRNSLRA